MKLAIITPCFMPVPAVNGGAVEQLITYFIEANEKYHKYDIDLYTVADEKLNSYTFKYTNIIQIKNYQSNYRVKGYYFLKRTFSNVFRIQLCSDYMSYKIPRIYKKNLYDLTLIENNMNLYNALINKKRNEKFFFHLHNDFDNGDTEKSKEKAERIIKTADGIITVSNFLKDKLLKYGAKNVFLAYNAVIVKNFHEVNNDICRKDREKYGFSKEDCVFTFIGRLAEEKGVDTFLNALEILKNKTNIKALVVGDSIINSGKEDAYRRMILGKANKLKEKVSLTGYVSNQKLSNLYSISDCIVVPSQVEEAFGMVALEAMNMKKPVIASKAGGLSEVLSNKGSILLDLNHNFTGNLAKAMRILASNKGLRKKMGLQNYLKAQQFPQSEFDYFKILARILK